MDYSPRKRAYSDEDEIMSSPTKRSRTDDGDTKHMMEPLVISDAPIHQDLWDQLPVGTIFEIARLARAADINLSAIPKHKLSELRGTNVHGISKLCKVLGISNAAVMGESVAELLDREAQCIVEGKGAMLECDLEPSGERRYGRVIFGASLSVSQLLGFSNSRSNQSGFTVRVPRTSQSCLFTRVFGSHRFFRVSLTDRLKANTDEHTKKLFTHSLRPIKILGRTYKPLVEKESTVWYYLEGRDRVGAAAEQAGGKAAGDYGLGRFIGNVEDFIDWWVPLETNGDQLVCKLVTRLHLGISSTWAGPLFLEGIEVPDIVRGEYTFTDGAGIVSEDLATDIWRQSPNSPPIPPSAYQIRFGTAKGVVQVAPREDNKPVEGRWLHLRSSMVKARQARNAGPGLVRGLNILDAAHHVACIVKPSACRTPHSLNVQIIPILCQQGVPERIIQNLQEQTIRSSLESLLRPSVSFSEMKEESRVSFAKAIQSYAHLVFKSQVSDPNYDCHGKSRSQASSFDSFNDLILEDRLSLVIEESPDIAYANSLHDCNEQLYLAVLSGFNVTASRYFVEIWKKLIEKAVKSAFADFHISLPGSALVTIVPDFTGKLEEGHIFFAPLEPIPLPTGGCMDFTSGSVLVGRNPALLCSDIQKVQLADVPELRERKGVIFFSTRGQRPLADYLAGGDYDGDEVILIWDQDIVQPFRNANFEDDDDVAAKARDSFKRGELKAESLYETLICMDTAGRERLLEEQLLSSLKVPPLLGRYYSFYLKAINHYGIDSHQARLMAHKFNIILDSPRTSWSLISTERKADEDTFGIWCHPDWKHAQNEFRRGSAITNEGQKFRTNIPNYLNNLWDHGKKTYEALYYEISPSRLEPSFDANQHRRLLRPFERAEDWMRQCSEQQAAEAEIGKIKSAVHEAHEEFIKIMKPRGEYAQKQLKLRQLTRKFESTPPLTELPILSNPNPITVHHIKVSYAYSIDTRSNFAGGAWGFPWRMACPTLLSFITDNPISLPHGTFSKLTPHHSFCKPTES